MPDFIAPPVTGPWISATLAAPVSETGAFGAVSATCRYKRIGKTVIFNTVVTITTAGTALGYIDVALPVTARDGYISLCGDSYLGLAAVSTANTTTVRARKYDGNTLILDGILVTISGTYEAA